LSAIGEQGCQICLRALARLAASVLHLGELLWGNIGAADRLDFTAIGSAVNRDCAGRSATPC
jgi:hypothetical protein